MHSDEWHAARRLGIGGSDSNVILGDDEERLIRLWQEKIGAVEPEDLSGVLPVQMGVATEPFNRAWFTKQTGRVVERHGDTVVSSEHPFMRANLDGITDDGKTYFEAKHLNAFTKEDDALRKYMPQLTHCMLVCGIERAVLSMFLGTQKYVAIDVELDPLYATHVIAAERAFWACVETKTPPAVVNVAAPVEAVKRVDMTGDNEFGSAASIWLSNKGYAQQFEKAAKELKAKTPDDAIEASGYGLVIKRNKAGNLSIAEMKK
jgi:putative phage-type endonuclease